MGMNALNCHQNVLTGCTWRSYKVADLSRATTVQIPWATVFRVEHCGFTVAWRSLDEDSEWDWHLEKQQEGSGVDWTL